MQEKKKRKGLHDVINHAKSVLWLFYHGELGNNRNSMLNRVKIVTVEIYQRNIVRLWVAMRRKKKRETKKCRNIDFVNRTLFYHRQLSAVKNSRANQKFNNKIYLNLYNNNLKRTEKKWSKISDILARDFRGLDERVKKKKKLWVLWNCWREDERNLRGLDREWCCANDPCMDHPFQTHNNQR